MYRTTHVWMNAKAYPFGLSAYEVIFVMVLMQIGLDNFLISNGTGHDNIVYLLNICWG